jgi:hypothetical protein
MRTIAVFLAALPLLASDDPNEIIKRFIAADSKNWERASQYTYVEQAEYLTPVKDGPAKKDRSETHEVIFVEGASYKKLVARNDKPLDAKERAKEEKRLQQTADERRKQAHSTLTHRIVNLGTYEDLLTLFDNRLVGEEEIRSHQCWVIESKPKPGHVPANDHEKDALSFEEKLWIDQAEVQLLKSVYTVVGPRTLAPGSTVSWEFDKINDDAWLVISGVIDGHLQFAKFIKPAVRTEYHNSKFQKFDVKSTITVPAVPDQWD